VVEFNLAGNRSGEEYRAICKSELLKSQRDPNGIQTTLATSRNCTIPAQIRRNQRVNRIRSKVAHSRFAQNNAVPASEFVRKVVRLRGPCGRNLFDWNPSRAFSANHIARSIGSSLTGAVALRILYDADSGITEASLESTLCFPIFFGCRNNARESAIVIRHSLMPLRLEQSHGLRLASR